MSRAECSIDGCSRPSVARTWCEAHWKRWRRHGDPLGGKHYVTDWRVAYVVDPGTGCWEWTGPKSSDGYGKYKHGLAHRRVYEELVGSVPEGLQLDHLCRNRGCVNPSHLEPVTQRENWWRGEAPSRQQVDRTHCPQGHPYSGDNLYINAASGGRVCRACTNEHQRRHRARERAGRY